MRIRTFVQNAYMNTYTKLQNMYTNTIASFNRFNQFRKEYLDNFTYFYLLMCCWFIFNIIVNPMALIPNIMVNIASIFYAMIIIFQQIEYKYNRKYIKTLQEELQHKNNRLEAIIKEDAVIARAALDYIEGLVENIKQLEQELAVAKEAQDITIEIKDNKDSN